MPSILTLDLDASSHVIVPLCACSPAYMHISVCPSHHADHQCIMRSIEVSNMTENDPQINLQSKGTIIRNPVSILKSFAIFFHLN